MNDSDLTQGTPAEEPKGTLSENPPAETLEDVEAKGSEDKDSEKNAFDEELEPEKLKGLTPKELEEKRKAFHSDYTRKTMKYAEDRRKWEADLATRDSELKTLKSQLNQLNQLATEVLKDPKKLEAYRQVYGPQLGIREETPDTIPQFETQDQLISWHNRQMQNLEQKLRNELRQENQNFYAQQNELVRWERAVQQISQDPFFKTHEKGIVALVKDPMFGLDSRYRAGQLDEAGVLREGIKRYKELIEPELKRVREEALSSLEKKQKATTARPTRPVPTERTQALTDAEILERIRSRVG